jgi:hypothetical protein
MHNLGQKYMGIRPERHQDLLHDTSMKPASGHDVLVDNFLNAQCMISPKPSILSNIADFIRFLRDPDRYSSPDLQGRS